MTAAAVDRPAQAPLLRRHWRLLALLLVGVAPFSLSLAAMRQFLLADNALGFVPFVPLVSAYLFWQRAHMRERAEKRDLLLDVFLSAPLAVAAVFIL